MLENVLVFPTRNHKKIHGGAYGMWQPFDGSHSPDYNVHSFNGQTCQSIKDLIGFKDISYGVTKMPICPIRYCLLVDCGEFLRSYKTLWRIFSKN